MSRGSPTPPFFFVFFWETPCSLLMEEPLGSLRGPRRRGRNVPKCNLTILPSCVGTCIRVQVYTSSTLEYVHLSIPTLGHQPPPEHLHVQACPSFVAKKPSPRSWPWNGARRMEGAAIQRTKRWFSVIITHMECEMRSTGSRQLQERCCGSIYRRSPLQLGPSGGPPLSRPPNPSPVSKVVGVIMSAFVLKTAISHRA